MNGLRSSFQIPEVHHELDNFITQLSIKSRTYERKEEFHVIVRRFAGYELQFDARGKLNYINNDRFIELHGNLQGQNG